MGYKNKADMTEYNKKYHKENKEKKKLAARAYRKKNRERIKKKSADYYLNNKERIKKTNSAWRKKNREKSSAQAKEKYWGMTQEQRDERNARANERAKAKKYGITVEEYRLYKDSPCEVCGRKDTNKRGVSFMDHCHDTGKFRGVLCHQCNAALGMLEESLERIESLSRYIKTKCNPLKSDA